MASLHDVVIDSRHPASIARFWAAVPDGYQVAPYDEAELARLRDKGIFDPEDDPSVLVEAPGTLPRIFFQLVPEPRTVKKVWSSRRGSRQIEYLGSARRGRAGGPEGGGRVDVRAVRCGLPGVPSCDW
jgi:hypothetical protein